MYLSPSGDSYYAVMHAFTHSFFDRVHGHIRLNVLWSYFHWGLVAEVATQVLSGGI